MTGKSYGSVGDDDDYDKMGAIDDGPGALGPCLPWALGPSGPGAKDTGTLGPRNPEVPGAQGPQGPQRPRGLHARETDPDNQQAIINKTTKPDIESPAATHRCDR